MGGVLQEYTISVKLPFGEELVVDADVTYWWDDEENRPRVDSIKPDFLVVSMGTEVSTSVPFCAKAGPLANLADKIAEACWAVWSGRIEDNCQADFDRRHGEQKGD